MTDQGSLFFDPHHQGVGGNMLFLGSNDQVLQGSRSMMGMEENLKRRSFFITQDDMYDEEYYDDQTPEKKRRLTAEQVHQLEKSFETENKLEPDRKTELAKKLGLQPRQVAVWFQNRRARWKTKQLERDYDVLKASYDSLLANYDSILKDNHKLKSEVITITKKLDAEDLPEAKGVSSFPSDHDHGDKCGHVHLLPSEKEMSFNEDPNAPMSCFQSSVKVEDRLSSGSGGSAVVDDESPQLVDSGDSYFPSGYDFAATTYDHLPLNAHCMGLVDEVHSEDDGHEDGRKYFSDVFSAAAVEAESEEGVPMGWWVWS